MLKILLLTMTVFGLVRTTDIKPGKAVEVVYRGKTLRNVEICSVVQDSVFLCRDNVYYLDRADLSYIRYTDSTVYDASVVRDIFEVMADRHDQEYYAYRHSGMISALKYHRITSCMVPEEVSKNMIYAWVGIMVSGESLDGETIIFRDLRGSLWGTHLSDDFTEKQKSYVLVIGKYSGEGRLGRKRYKYLTPMQLFFLEAEDLVILP